MTVERDTSPAVRRVRPPRAAGQHRVARRAPRRRPGSSSSSPTRTCCSTRPATSRARSRSTGTPTSTTRSTRDYVDGAGFAALLGRKGISRDTTVVIYGDKNNWWAAYALWVFTLFGHEDVRLLDGGRAKWDRRGPRRTRPTCPTPRRRRLPGRRARRQRASAPTRTTCSRTSASPLIDVRSPEEYVGERTTAPAYPEEGALRAGHIPTAQNVPWAQGGRRGRHASRPRDELERDLPRRGRPEGRRRRHRLLPHRRALEPHLVRAHPPARLRERAQLRRLVDRVGQRGARADRQGRRARRAVVRAPRRVG